MISWLRASSQAIMIGSGTALADAPRLTRRPSEGVLPAGCLPPLTPLLRVVLDARGQVTAGPLTGYKVSSLGGLLAWTPLDYFGHLFYLGTQPTTLASWGRLLAAIHTLGTSR